MKNKIILGLVVGFLAIVCLISISNTSEYKEVMRVQEIQIAQLSKEKASVREVTNEAEAFRNSFKGHEFEMITRKFVKACLSGDVQAMKGYLLNPNDQSLYESKLDYYDKTSFLILKLASEDIKENSVIAEYEFDIKGEDSLSYLNLEVLKVDGVWKIKHWNLQK